MLLSSVWRLSSRSDVRLVSVSLDRLQKGDMNQKERRGVQGEGVARTKGAALKWRRHLKWLNKEERI